MTAVTSHPPDRPRLRAFHRSHPLGLTVAVLVVSAVAVGSAFRAPKPTSTPATAMFRCYSTDATCVAGDRVRDDGGPYNGVINAGTFDLQIPPASGRSLQLYLLDVIPGSRTCPTTGNCNPHGPLDDQAQPLILTNASIRVKALTLDTNGYQDLAGGLTAMSCGAINPGLVHFTFWMPDGDGHWGLNFNPREYPDTNAAKLTRENPGTWTVETELGINDRGELLSWAHSGIKRHNGPSREGQFHVPFRFTITALGLTCP
jgi:hypothetical protein